MNKVCRKASRPAALLLLGRITIVYIAAAVWSAPAVKADYTFSTIASFSYYANGAYPHGGHLTLDANGNLYGTASQGGDQGWGTVFEYSASTRSLAALGSFDQSSGVRNPYGGVVFDAAGNLYGTSSGDLPAGFSFVWSATTRTISTYRSFGGSAAPGFVTDSNGNIYGALQGGAPLTGSTPDSIFRFSPATRVFTTLASFSGNGNQPNNVILDAQENVYGTTYLGGADNLGTVFEVDAATHTLTTLATFNGTNGANPSGGLFLGPDLNLYGTTVYGGSGYGPQFAGQGTVFKYDPTSHVLTTLASLNNSLSGGEPQGGVVMGSDGSLYGTTTFQVLTNDGTIFRLDPTTGSLSTVASFTGQNGSFPDSDLIADSEGNIYGTTNYGGINNDGTIFKLSVPEPQSLVFLIFGAGLCLRRRRVRPGSVAAKSRTDERATVAGPLGAAPEKQVQEPP